MVQSYKAMWKNFVNMLEDEYWEKDVLLEDNVEDDVEELFSSDSNSDARVVSNVSILLFERKRC